MSGPVTEAEAPADIADCSHPEHACMQVTESRESQVGRFTVRRALPRRGRRTVGAWCFADHMGPADVTENSGLDVGPHPHIGLQTVTWLTDGEVLHRDSLGSEQVIKPGQLNLMTSGEGITHSEEATGHYRGTLEGIQLWVALPESTRAGEGGFEHHAELPRFDVDGGVVTVLLGDLPELGAGGSSPARHDTPLVGAELDLRGPTTLPLRADWEYALVVLEGELAVNGQPLVPGRLGYLGEDRDELPVEVKEPTRALLIGGEPFPEPIIMWWNFVARTQQEVEAAWRSWQAQDDRFGRVDSPLDHIPAKPPWWVKDDQKA
jgi:quercetin 2,3-dioxygenase